jgi:hypothetical protein
MARPWLAVALALAALARAGAAQGLGAKPLPLAELQDALFVSQVVFSG